MLDIGQYDFQDRHQMLQREYQDSVALQRTLIKQVRQVSNQLRTLFVEVGKQAKAQAPTIGLQGQS